MLSDKYQFFYIPVVLKAAIKAAQRYAMTATTRQRPLAENRYTTMQMKRNAVLQCDKGLGDSNSKASTYERDAPEPIR